MNLARRRVLRSSSTSLLALLGLTACGSDVQQTTSTTGGSTGASTTTGSTSPVGPGGGAGGDGSGGASPDHPPTCDELATAVSVSVSAVSGGGVGGAGAGGAPSFEAPSPCTDPEPIVVGCLDTGVDRCAEGILRRREAVACPTWHRPDATCEDSAGGCVSDGACGTGKICGFTATAPPQGGFCECKGCEVDADCGAGELCLCGEGAGQCVPASCRTDADCDPGAFCASYDETYNVECSAPGLGGFACQTAMDTCAVAADCPDAGEFGDGTACSVDASGVRVCTTLSCGVGRPLIVAGELRVAPAAARDDWATGGDVATASIDDATCRRLAAHWTAIGALEHASVASFARFAMELLALGAPPDLVARAQRAMGDEIEHARLAYGLASAYAGAPLGPGPLDVSGALGAVDLVDFAVRTFVEGCIAEGVASAEAAECEGAATDPRVASVLATIAREEGEHAALAWSTLQWTLVAGGSRVADAIAAALAREALHAAATPSAATADDGSLAAFGVLSAREQGELRRAYVRDVVHPVLDALLRRGAARTACGTAQFLA